MAPSKSTMTPAPDDAYNWACDYEVVIDHPLDKVFAVLGDGDNIEAVIRLSPICTAFEVHTDKSDFVVTPNGAPLSSSRVHHAPSATPLSQEDGEGTGSKLYPRRHFYQCQTIKMIWGFASTDVHIQGTYTWDESEKVGLFETRTPQGVEVWRYRRFEAVEERGKERTRVVESLRGISPALFKSIVEKQGAQQHREQMDRYHTLFSEG